MGELFFVVKTLAITVVIVLLMQIKIGRSTIEEHSLAWIHGSSFADNLRAIAEGAVVVTEKGYDFVSDAVGSGKKALTSDSSSSKKHSRHRRAERRDQSTEGPMGDEID